MKFGVVFLLLVCHCQGQVTDETEARVLKDSEADGPVRRVVALLKDLKQDMLDDKASTDKAMKKYYCWCENVLNIKQRDIDDNNEILKNLQQTIQELTAKKLTAEKKIADAKAAIAEAEKDIAEAQSARAAARSLHEKNAAEAKELLNAVYKAIAVISKGQGQKDFKFLQVGGGVRAIVEKIPMEAVLPEPQLQLLQSIVSGEYTPQSSAVLGLLKEMFIDFAKRLQHMNKEDAHHAHLTEVQIFTNEEKIKTNQELMARTLKELADIEKKLASAHDEFTDTTIQVATDTKFARETSKVCTDKVKKWRERDNQRVQELKAVKATIRILNNPKNRALFSDAIKPGMETASGLEAPTFLQVHNSQDLMWRKLKYAVAATHNIELASLVALASMKAGPKESERYKEQDRKASRAIVKQIVGVIDKILKRLDDETAEDIQMLDECKAKEQHWKMKVEDSQWRIDVNNKKIKVLKLAIKEIKEEIAKKEAAIEANKQTIKELEAKEAEEVAAHKHARSQDTKAIRQLERAAEALAKFFEAEATEFLQKPVFEAADEDDTLVKNKLDESRDSQVKLVQEFMAGIIKDLKKEKLQDQADRDQAHEEFKKLKAELEQQIENLTSQIASLDKEKAGHKAQTAAEKKDRKANNKALDAANTKWLGSEKVEGEKENCVWIFNSFEMRSKNRAVEKLALEDAKAFISVV